MKALCLLMAVLLSGCATTFRRQPKTEAAITERARENVQAAGIAVDRSRIQIAQAAVISPTNEPLRSAEASTRVASSMLTRAGALIGAPAENQAPLVEGLLSTNQVERVNAERAAGAEVKSEGLLMLDNRTQIATLLEEGKKYEEEHNRSLLRRIWTWTLGTFGIGGLVALCILFPAVVPLLGSILGWLIGKIPILAHYLGVVGTSAYSRAVTAIQESKRAAQLTGQPGAEEIVRRCTAENTGPDTALVRSIKSKLGYAAAEKKWSAKTG